VSIATCQRLDDDPIANFDNVQVWECHGGMRQQWQIIHKGYPNNNIALTSDGKVLDILTYSNDTSANLQI
jgi:hypothetical protein